MSYKTKYNNILNKLIKESTTNYSKYAILCMIIIIILIGGWYII